MDRETGKITKSNMQTEGVNPVSVKIDLMSPFEIVKTINHEDFLVAEAVGKVLQDVAAAIEGIAARLKRGGRLIYMGAGTSGRLGVLDASECPPTYSTAPETVVARIAGGPTAMFVSAEEAEDEPQRGRQDAIDLGLNEKDALVGITASGSTPYVLGALDYGREIGALTIGVACNSGMPIEKAADISIIPLVGPEVISGSTRMKAGTAQKMVLNMLSTGTMILLGKTFGNLMVDVKPTNAKLRRRANKIVQLATGLNETEVTRLMLEAEDEPKTAIVAALGGVTPKIARQKLAETGGVVRLALETLP